MKNLSAKSILRSVAICFALSLFSRAGAQVQFAQSDLFNILESSCSYYLNVEANDSFSGTVLLQVVTQPAHGAASINGSYITYCPNNGFTGADHFTYGITGGGHGDTATVYLNVQPFNSIVYPGDADQNGKVENFDILAIGLAYSATGPSRQDSLALNALAWPPSPFINSNPGAADCDGNGIVDSLDLTPVNVFYNDTAPFGSHYDIDTSTCGNGMSFNIEGGQGDTINNGDTLHVIINLGAGTGNQAYGIAFTLNYDTSFIPRNSIQFSTASSWLLQNDRGLFFHRESQDPGRIDIALTKTNQQVAHGGGTAVSALIPIDDNICGFNHAPGWYTLYLSLSQPRLINQYNELEEICIEQPSIMVYKDPAAIGKTPASDISVYPNPASDEIFIRAVNIEQVDITDLTGRKIYSARFAATAVASVDVKALGIEAGAYMVHVNTAQSAGVRKIIIQ